MSTPRRRVNRVAARGFELTIVALLLASSAFAAESEVLVDGLSRPTGLAVATAPSGEAFLLVAEGDAGRVVGWPLDAIGRQAPRTFLRGLDPGRIVLAAAPDGCLVVGGEEVLSVELWGEQPVERARAATPARPAAIAGSHDYVFAIADGALMRSRRVAGRLTEFRGIEVPGATLAFAPRGYLALVADGSPPRIKFLNPVEPEARAAVLPIDGADDLIAIAYSPIEEAGALYAIDPDGLVRIDARFDHAGRQRGGAERLAAIESPTALATGPSGEVYVAADDPRRGGLVLRIVDTATALTTPSRDAEHRRER